MGAVMFVPVVKADADARRKREIDIGLANNAFGAAAGVMGTRAVYRQSRKKHLPAREARYQAKVAARNAARQAKGPSWLARQGAKVSARVPARVKALAVPAAVGGAVGMQLVNAGADAQSAAFFANERRKMTDKPKGGAVVKADNGIGTFYDRDDEISKDAWVDPEVRRQRQLAATSVGGLLLGGGGIAYGGRNLLRTPAFEQYQAMETRKNPPTRVNGKFASGGTSQVPVTRTRRPDTIGQALRMGARRVSRRRVGIPLAAGTAALGISGAAYKLGHGKNERPWQ